MKQTFLFYYPTAKLIWLQVEVDAVVYFLLSTIQ